MSEDAAVYQHGSRKPVAVESIDFTEKLTECQQEALKEAMNYCHWYTTFGSGHIVFGYHEGTTVLVLAGNWVEPNKFVVKDFDFDDGTTRKFMRLDAIVEMRKK